MLRECRDEDGIQILSVPPQRLVQRLPSPLPLGGHLAMRLTLPFADPKEPPTLETAAFASVREAARDGGWTETSLPGLLAAAAAARPFSAYQGLSLLEAIILQIVYGGTGGANEPTPSTPRTPSSSSNLSHSSPPPASRSARERPRSAVSGTVTEVSLSAQPPTRPTTACQLRPHAPTRQPPSRRRPSTSTVARALLPSATGVPALDTHAQRLLARVVPVLAPLVVLSQRGLFLVNAWRQLVRASEPQCAAPHSSPRDGPFLSLPLAVHHPA